MNQPILRGGRVVIVGGGVVGLSIAFHLAKGGYRDVTLVERSTLGSGTTSKGVGGLRQQFSSDINIALSRRAIDYFSRFEELVGEPVTLRQHGFLFLVDGPHWDIFRVNAERQRAAGVPVEVLAPAEIPRLFPGVNLDGLVGATFCPTDGSAVPGEVVGVLARRARELGAKLHEETEVVAIERDRDGAVVAVLTNDSRFECELVINAAGPWATGVGRLAGVELPIAPRRRQAFAIDAPSWLTPDLPFTIDLASGGYVQPRPVGAVIGGNDRNVPDGFGADVDWELAEPLVAALTHRIPALSGISIKNGWAGVRDMTADDHAIIGPVADVPGLWVAAGFSGHGFVHSPVIGELLAQWLLTGAPDLDLNPLRLERFTEGKANLESAVF